MWSRLLILGGLSACAPTSPPTAPATPDRSCASCHPTQTSGWRSSDHARAARRAPAGARRILTDHPDPMDEVLHVGIRPLWQPVVRGPDGTRQVAPTGIVSRTGEEIRLGDPDARPGDWGHWTGAGLHWDTRCAACHTSPGPAVDTADVDPDDPTRVLGVTCTACHGDASAHAASPGRPPPIAHPAATAEGTCGPCHTRGQRLEPAFAPGDALLDAVLPSLPALDDGWHPDGQPAEETFVGVPHQLGAHAALSCTTCHDAHTGALHTPGDRLCATCHADAPDHDRHPEGAAACVDCHLPTATVLGVDARRDHRVAIPDPVLAARLGTPSACDGCHDRAVLTDPAWQDVSTTARALSATLLGEDVPRPAGVSPLWRATWLMHRPPRDPARLAALDDRDPRLRLGALTGLALDAVPGGLRPDDPVPAVRMAQRRVLTQGQTPDESALRPLRRWLSAAGAPPARWLELAAWADRWQNDPLAAQAVDRALDLDRSHPEATRFAAILLARDGRLAQAEARLRDALATSPTHAGLLDALARVLDARGDRVGALTALARACAHTLPSERAACEADLTRLRDAVSPGGSATDAGRSPPP